MYNLNLSNTIQSRAQSTVARSSKVTGFGYWSGQTVTIEFRPAEAGTGVIFVRQDLPQPSRIPVAVSHRIESPRRTTLAVGEHNVEMVEHILAALMALQIDNCEVWVDQPEMPGCDGSSQPFVDALLEAGRVEQDVPRQVVVVKEQTRVGDDECWVEAQPSNSGTWSLKYRLDYGDGPIGRQTIELQITPESFQQELASARTFLLQEEAEWMRQQGLGSHVTYNDLLVFGPDGPIENELRFMDECVRHKALDLVGDLALAGCDFVGHFVAHRSGHRLNAELVRALLQEEQIVTHRKSA